MVNKRNLIIAGVVLLIVIFLFIPKNKKNSVRGNDAVPEDRITAQELYRQAVAQYKDGNLIQAKETLRSIISDYPSFENIESVQKELGDLNIEIIFSNALTEDTVMHEVVKGDTLGELAKKYGTTVELIKRSNNLSNNIIRIGQKLRIWTSPFNVFVDKSQNILMLKKGEEVLKVYNVSTGSNNSTPVGNFTITTKLIDPVWFNRGVVVPPESPQNVLGSRWLGFDIAGYGIHGTIEPETIGQQVTAGCIRMRNNEVEELYAMLPRGVKVEVVD